MATRNRTLDILVIGAGQADLAMGYHLKATPFTFHIVDCHRRIGDSWRKRYDSLVLFTPGTSAAFPAWPSRAAPVGIPRKVKSPVSWRRTPPLSSLPWWEDTPSRGWGP